MPYWSCSSYKCCRKELPHPDDSQPRPTCKKKLHKNKGVTYVTTNSQRMYQQSVRGKYGKRKMSTETKKESEKEQASVRMRKKRERERESIPGNTKARLKNKIILICCWTRRQSFQQQQQEPLLGLGGKRVQTDANYSDKEQKSVNIIHQTGLQKHQHGTRENK